MQAIGYYHSHRPALGLPYQARVRNAAAMLFTRLGTAAPPPVIRQPPLSVPGGGRAGP